MRTIAFLSISILCQAWMCVASATAIRIESGTIEGVKASDGLTVYKGVPYARPPVGELRWREPQRLKASGSFRKADQFAPACMQEGVSMPGETPPKVSEDCLYLNIWSPAKNAAQPFPVIVWIHGGGYTNGSASMPLYWGERLARKNVVVVSVAYRLGPLGFLALPELTHESPHHSSGNYGLMDQLAALEWIQRNIAAFGGDPKCVTVAGQSSGSISVSILMASPLAKGLFQRAIGQSGGLFEPLQLAPKFLLVNAERDGEKFAESLGANSLEKLRGLPATLLIGNPGDIVHPVVEPYVLPREPYQVFLSGKQNDVPLLLGSNAEEARSLTDVSHVTATTYERDIETSFGALPAPLIAAYPHASDREAQTARLDFERDLRFGWDMWAWAGLQATTGESPVFFYSFQQKPPFPKGSVYEGWGASHFAELWYVFDHISQEPWQWTDGDRRLARDVSSYWANFAKSGNPNGPDVPFWPAFSRTESKVQHLVDPVSTGGVVALESLKVFDSVYSTLRAPRL